MLKLLSARFVHPGPPQLTILLMFFEHELVDVRTTKTNKILILAFLNENFLNFFSRNQSAQIDPIFLFSYISSFLFTITSELPKYLN